jgi:hypothetical protein
MFYRLPEVVSITNTYARAVLRAHFNPKLGVLLAPATFLAKL